MPGRFKPVYMALLLLGAALSTMFVAPACHAQTNSETSPASPEVQILTLVAQAEHVDRKCDAFTHEGQFVYREMKSRLLNMFNEPLFKSISKTQAPFFAGKCSELAGNAKARAVVGYFNGEGARMLALHFFLPEDSPCTFANKLTFRQRAAKAWKTLLTSKDPRMQRVTMQQEADMIAAQCSSFLQPDRRGRSHLAAFMAQTLAPIYDMAASYRGEMTVMGSLPDAATTIYAFRDPSKEVVKGGILAGEYRGTSTERLGILRDGRLALMNIKDRDIPGFNGIVFTAGAKEYVVSEARSTDPAYPKIFVLDKKSSDEILAHGARSTFSASFIDASGNATFWDEPYEFAGRKKSDRGGSVRPIRFDPSAFRAALDYSNAPDFR